jgi:hypothetical protein
MQSLKEEIFFDEKINNLSIIHHKSYTFKLFVIDFAEPNISELS